MAKRKTRQSSEPKVNKPKAKRLKGNKNPSVSDTPIFVFSIVNRIRKHHLPIAQITEQVVIAEILRQYGPDHEKSKLNKKAKKALEHLLGDTYEEERQGILKWTRSMKTQEINSTGMLVEVIDLESEDDIAAATEGGQGESNDEKPEINLDLNEILKGSQDSGVAMNMNTKDVSTIR